MRTVKQLAAILLVLGASLSPAFAQQSIRENLDLDLLWEQVHAQPDDFSVACMPLNGEHNATFYNADERFPLSSVAKLLIFIEYARRVDEGTYSFSQMVDVMELNRYDLSRTDGGAHAQFLALYPLGTRKISLWDIAATGMIQYSSNAASDYLLDRLRPVNWNNLYQMLGLTNTGYPHSLGMIPLLMNNHETGNLQMKDVQALSMSQGEMLFERYIYDTSWRQEEIEYRAKPGRTFPGWSVQAAILQQHTVNGTTADFLKVMEAIYGEDSPLNKTTQAMAQLALQWHDYEAIDDTYAEYGAKLGFYSGGLLTLVAYGDTYDGDPVVSAAFFRNIPRDNYNYMLDHDSIGDLAHWMNLNECAGLLEAIEKPPDEDEATSTPKFGGTN